MDRILFRNLLHFGDVCFTSPNHLFAMGQGVFHDFFQFYIVVVCQPEPALIKALMIYIAYNNVQIGIFGMMQIVYRTALDDFILLPEFRYQTSLDIDDFGMGEFLLQQLSDDLCGTKSS